MCEHGLIGACAECDGCGLTPEPDDFEELNRHEALDYCDEGGEG